MSGAEECGQIQDKLTETERLVKEYVERVMEAVRRRAAVQSQERLQEAEIAESAPEPIQYAYWRTDKAKEDGFSHELISYDAAKILDKTDIDTLDVQPYPEINTILKAIRRNVHRIKHSQCTLHPSKCVR